MSAVTDLDSIPKPITPGPEMAALARFHTDVTWTGTIQAGGMGPGTPVMTAVGWGKHETIQDGRWIVGTYQQDQFLPDNTFVLTWQLHWVAGWDPTAGEYRATLADNYGHADVMRGWIEGDRLRAARSAGHRPVGPGAGSRHPWHRPCRPPTGGSRSSFGSPPRGRAGRTRSPARGS
jgi:hypothetical protein